MNDKLAPPDAQAAAANVHSDARSPAGARGKFKGCVTCGSTDYPHDCTAPEPSAEHGYKTLFESACRSIGEISSALGIPDDLASCANGNDAILEAIAALKGGACSQRCDDAGEVVETISVLHGADDDSCWDIEYTASPEMKPLPAELSAKDYISLLPADWFKDSSLETWFPLTAEELKRLRMEVETLRRAPEPVAKPVPDDVRAAIEEYNSLLRTFHSIAERNGAVTLWEGLAARIKAALNKHHATWRRITNPPDAPVEAQLQGTKPDGCKCDEASWGSQWLPICGHFVQDENKTNYCMVCEHGEECHALTKGGAL